MDSIRIKSRNDPSSKQLSLKLSIYSKVLGKADRHPALALVDLQTQVVDLINSKFVHLYCIPIGPSEKKTLTTAIKGSQGTIDKECTMQLNWIGYLKESTFYVAQLSV